MGFRYIGKKVNRNDAKGLAMGEVIYGGDLKLPNMLVAKAFRSNVVHADVLSIDTSEALMVPGVVKIITAEDIPGVNLHGIHKLDQPVLVPVGGRVRMLGDPIAVVAAERMDVVDKALSLIKVQYKALKIVSDPILACKEGSFQVHDDKYAKEYEYSTGDVDKTLNDADVVIEHTQHIPMQEHAYIETEAGISYYDPQGVLVSYSPSHDPFNIRHQIARTLGITVGKVRAIVPPLGGSFGGKQAMTVHLHTALISFITKRPVRMVLTREESMMVSVKRHSGVINMKLGATKDGKITALKADFILDAGAYTDHSPGVTTSVGVTLPGPYYIPNISVEGKAIYTNNPIGGAFRGYGGPQSTVALERAIYILAEKLGMDQVEIRKKNSLQMGDKVGNSVMITDSKVTICDTIDKVLEAAGSLPKPSGPTKKVGRGIACGIPQFDISAKPYNGLTGIGAEVELLFDGTLQARTGIVEMGTGIRTAIAQVVAEEMNVNMDNIEVILSDTMLTPKAGPTVASRSMYCAGNAVKNAAIQLRERIFDKAAIKFGVPSYCIRIDDEKIFALGMEEKVMTLEEFAGSAFVEGVNLVSYSWFVGTHAKLGQTYLTSLADVEVDIETGETEVLFLGTCHDTGKVINPLSVKGQIIGGAVMGKGWALTEEIKTINGELINKTLEKYYIPTSLDIPDKTVAISIEDPYPSGPYGAKGVGEHSMYTIAPAILNAICDAVKINLTTFPATPELVWREMRNQGKKESDIDEI